MLQEYVVRAKAVAEKLKEEFDAFAKTVTPEEVIRYNQFKRSKGEYGIRVKFSGRPVHSFMRRVSCQIYLTHYLTLTTALLVIGICNNSERAQTKLANR